MPQELNFLTGSCLYLTRGGHTVCIMTSKDDSYIGKMEPKVENLQDIIIYNASGNALNAPIEFDLVKGLTYRNTNY